MLLVLALLAAPYLVNRMLKGDDAPPPKVGMLGAVPRKRKAVKAAVIQKLFPQSRVAQKAQRKEAVKAKAAAVVRRAAAVVKRAERAPPLAPESQPADDSYEEMEPYDDFNDGGDSYEE